MTVSTQQSQIIVAGTGVSTLFQFPFIADQASDISVSYIDANGNQTVLTTTQYTLTLNAAAVGQLWGVGGTVLYPNVGSPIAIGTSLLIERNIPLTQEVSIRNQGNFYAEVTEQALDIVTMQLQQLAARTGQFRGIWATTLNYNFGDIVVDGVNGANTGNYYMCAIANTSSVWATDLSNGDWTLIINIQQINADVAACNAAAATATAAASSASSSASSASSSATTATTEAGIATTEAGIATSAAVSAAASAAAAASSAAAAQNINGTSITSQGITTGPLTFVTQSGKLFVIGEFVTIASSANAANYMHGQVTAYSGTSLTVNVADTGGTGTHADWNIMLSGTQGPAGPSGTGASPAGTPGQVQYYSLTSNTFAAFTMGGDGTLNTGSGTLTVTKTMGVAFAASATTDTTNASNISAGTLGSARGGAGVINGILKGSGSGVVTAASLNVDFQGPIVLTTTGSSGSATFNGTTLNIPVYSGGGGGGGVSSVTFTGDGVILSSTPSSAVTSTGTLTATLLAVTPKSVLGNTSTSTFQPSFVTSPVVSGASTAASFIPTNPSVPANGLYLAAANSVGISNSSTPVAFFSGSGTGADALLISSQSAGNGPIVGINSSGTNSPLILTSKGTGAILLYSGSAGTLLATFSSSGAATLNVAGATQTAGSFTTNSSAVPVDGLYLPSAHTPGIASNSKLVASFNSPGVGGDSWLFSNVASSGISAVTAPTAPTAALAGGGVGNLSAGNYSYRITYVGTDGETALGTTSNVITVVAPGTNGKMSLTSVPVSGSGTVTARNIYRTTAGGGIYFFLHQIADNSTTTYSDNIADTALAFQGPASQSQIPTYVTFVPASSGGDTSIGVKYNSIGTTTTGSQYNGAIGTATNLGSTPTTGTHDFYCNNVLALRITDNYWNPNQIYNGANDSYLIASSGNYSGNPDSIAVLSVGSSIYPSIVSGVTLALGSKGTAGQIHFIGNGALGHVTISPPQGNNPTATDAYSTNNSLRFAGSFPGSGFDPVIYTQFAGGAGDSALGLTFYLEGTGAFQFKSNNTSNTLFRLFNNYNAVFGEAALATTATAGFPWIASCPGKPTGSATAPYSNATALVFDSTNQRLYQRCGGVWYTPVGSQTGTGAIGTLVLTANITYLTVGTSGGVASFALPAASIPGRTVVLIDYQGNSGSNNITTTVVSGGTINGASSVVTNANYSIVNFIDNGTSWNA